MPENEITCIFFEIDTGMLTSIQFRCEIERPFTNLNDISTKLAGKTYILSQSSRAHSFFFAHLFVLKWQILFFLPFFLFLLFCQKLEIFLQI